MSFIKTSTNNKSRKKNNVLINLLKFSFLIIILQLIQSTNGDLDWMQTCDPCHCQWNSGKKTADCKNKNLFAVPHNLSNELQVIDLSQNMVTGLRPKEFMEANLNNLHKIFMRNSSMQKIHRDALEGLTILIEIDFSYNYVRELNTGTFKGLSKLRILVMNNNEIEVLPNFLFANLDYLSRVEFKNNHLKNIEINVFGSLPLLSTVYLEANQLTLLQRETFSHTPKLLHLSLAQNPWNCSCELKEFRDFSINNRLYTPPTACQEPSNLRGKQWNQVPSDSFACQPRVLGTQHTFVEAHMNNVTLPCKIESVPRPNITWFYNKRPINLKDYRYKLSHTYETSHRSSSLSVMTSVLCINDLRPNDIGIYTCIAENRGGRTEAEFELLIGNEHGLLDHNDKTVSATISDTYSNVWLIICLIATLLLFLLIVIVLMIFWYCRRIKAYQKNTTIATDSMKSKSNKTEGSMLAGGSIIREMQKSLLNEVNPVEKPPRRTEHDSITGEDEDVNDMKKTLLDENAFFYCRSSLDEDANVSNTKLIQQQQQQQQQQRRNFVENSLPPDLLSFPARGTPTSPSIKSSLTNLPEHIIYGVRSSPLTSPLFAHMAGQGIYDSMFIKPASNGFMTLQHPKTRNTSLSMPIATGATERQIRHPQQQFPQEESPFTPAPVIYTPPQPSALVIKQGYMTLPRKPRVPSWTSVSSRIMSQQQQQLQLQQQQTQQNNNNNDNNNKLNMPNSGNSSENSSTANLEFLMEPVYDNLGVRTTAGGNSTLNLNKTNPIQDTVVRYSMRHRPLPATPSLNSGNNNLSMEIEHEHENQSNNDLAAMPTSNVPLYASANINQQCSSSAKVYEPVEEIYSRQHQQHQQQQPASFLNDYRYTSNENNNSILSNKGEVLIKSTKTPPQPPPKPKKKLSLTTSIKGQGQRNKSKIFDDEGDDGTEV